MKTVVVLTLLLATVYCLPVKRSASSSESSEEQPAPMLQKNAAKLVQEEPAQTTPSESNESTNSADDTEETNSSESDSEETHGTFGPPIEVSTLNPIINTGRGDSLGYAGDYKKAIVYVDAKNYEKYPSPYKSYSNDKFAGSQIVSKKMSAYNGQDINDVEKELKLYKALKVHNDLLEEEDTSTPEMEATLGDEVVSVVSQDNDTSSAGDSSSASSSQEETDSSKSNEETTATTGGTDGQDDSSQTTESTESIESIESIESAENQESDDDTTHTYEPFVSVIAK